MAQPARKLTGPISVRFGQEDRSLVRTLRARATVHRRSLSEQMKYYAHLGIIAEDNPDLPLSTIAGILEAQAELRAGLAQPYVWGVIDPERV